MDGGDRVPDGRTSGPLGGASDDPSESGPYAHHSTGSSGEGGLALPPTADPDGAWTAAAPPRSPTLRLLTLVLIVVLLLVGAFGGFLGRPAQVRHVAQTLPPVEQPTGQLARAYANAREATVRIEARCGARYSDEPIGLGTGFFIRSGGSECGVTWRVFRR